MEREIYKTKNFNLSKVQVSTVDSEDFFVQGICTKIIGVILLTNYTAESYANEKLYIFFL